MRILYLDSFAGIAGDMFTAAFLDAGLVHPDLVRSVPSLLGAPDVQVEITSVLRAGARFTKVGVVPEGGGGDEGHDSDGEGHGHQAHDHHHAGESHHRHLHDSGGHHHDTHQDGGQPSGAGHRHQHHRSDGHHHHHPYATLVQQIESSGLDPFAKEFALRVFHLLAEAEAHSHGVPLEKVAFHEVGAVDSVVDVAMAGVCLGAVAPDRVMASPVKLGRGRVRIEHGTYPVPPPASARLAVGMPVAPVPEAITRPNVELSTPTGLAILKATEPAFLEGWPAGTLLAQGSGAGTTDLGSYPNVFRVALFEGPGDPGARQAPSSVPADEANPAGEAVKAGNPGTAADLAELPYETDRVVEIRCNVDDQTGERTAWLVERALEMGALDAWVTPLVGKKGRPAVCIVLLVPPGAISTYTDFLLRHSSSFGVRYATWDRLKLVRETEVRDTPRGPVSFSVGRTRDGEWVKEKPEFEDLKKIWREDPNFRP